MESMKVCVNLLEPLKNLWNSSIFIGFWAEFSKFLRLFVKFHTKSGANTSITSKCPSIPSQFLSQESQTIVPRASACTPAVIRGPFSTWNSWSHKRCGSDTGLETTWPGRNSPALNRMLHITRWHDSNERVASKPSSHRTWTGCTGRPGVKMYWSCTAVATKWFVWVRTVTIRLIAMSCKWFSIRRIGIR